MSDSLEALVVPDVPIIGALKAESQGLRRRVARLRKELRAAEQRARRADYFERRADHFFERLITCRKQAAEAAHLRTMTYLQEGGG